jgi:hypothetical protein
MRYVEDFSDQRQKAWCIHCGRVIANVTANRDHIPTKSLLSKELRELGANFDKDVFRQEGWEYDRVEAYPDGYLPQVLVCRKCNSSFSKDETYLLCVLHAIMAGSLYPDQNLFPEAANVLRSNRNIVKALKAKPDGQLPLFNDLPPFTLYPDVERISRVVLKNARGHAYHEIGEPLMQPPKHVRFSPLEAMNESLREDFESIGGGLDLWPEVGSRMMLQHVNGDNLAGGWISVEHNRYRYALDWSSGVKVRTVIWEYLATETWWDA